MLHKSTEENIAVKVNQLGKAYRIGVVDEKDKNLTTAIMESNNFSNKKF
jgi:hypothetical protein